MGAAGNAGAPLDLVSSLLLEAKIALGGGPPVSCWAKLAPKAGDEG